MHEIFPKIRNFIREIQRSGDATKKRWLVIFSSVGVLIVVVLWVAYLNMTLPRTTATPETTSTPAVTRTEPENGLSFFETVGLGWKTIWSDAESGVKSITESVESGWSKFKEQMNRTNDMNLENPASTPAAN
jgi:hypothetical protein